MPDETDQAADILARLQRGEVDAPLEAFAAWRGRLHQVISLRMDRRLQGRLDVEDVLQEVYLDYQRRLPEYLAQPTVSLYWWLRQLAMQRLIDLHRRHLQAEARDARLEVSLHSPLVAASSAALAEQLVGRLTTASQAVARSELRLTLETALNALEPLDREVLTLRHFEMLTNQETAEVLGLSKSAASNRYVRALVRLKEILPGI